MKKLFILVTAVLVSSLLLVGCMKTPSFDRLIPDVPGGLTDKTSGSVPREERDTLPAETGKQSQGKEADSELRTSYEAYLDARAILLSRLTAAFNQVPEAGMEASYSLFGFSMIDFMMWPAAIIWEDDATAEQMAGVFGALDMKFERAGGKSILTYTRDGDAAAFVGEPIRGADGYTFTAAFGGQEKLRSEFVRTAYGFAGQYFQLGDDGENIRYMITMEGQDGTVGIDKDAVRPGVLTGKEGPDFPQSAPEWYRIQGKRLTGVNAEGKTIDAVLP